MYYRTNELEVAAYLKAKGHRLIEAIPQGRLVTFTFGEAAANDATAYFAGAQMPARELFEAHRCLRALIQQVKEHQYNTTDKSIYDIRTR